MSDEVIYGEDLRRVDWGQMKATLPEGKFDNGRTPEQLRASFAASTELTFCKAAHHNSTMKHLLMIIALAVGACHPAARAQNESSKSPQAPVSERQFNAPSETLARLFRAANEAIIARSYDQALQYYDQIIAADPNHPAPWTNKAWTLLARGVARYNAALLIPDKVTKRVEVEAARQDFRDAAEAATKATQLIKTAPPTEQEGSLITFDEIRLTVLRVRAQAMHFLVTRVDPSYASIGLNAVHEYLALETDPSIKLQSQVQAGQMMLTANANDKANEEFQKVLTEDPDNVEAILGAGVALVNIGYMTNDQARLQTGLDLLQRFVDKAPETHRMKGSAEEALNYLRTLGPVMNTPSPAGAEQVGRASATGEHPPAEGDGSSGPTRGPVPGGVLNGKAISLPKPPYPLIARVAHAQGTISVRVIINEAGNVIDARAVAGHPLLLGAAAAAARQARFTPTTLSGRPVKVSGIITYNFIALN